MSNNDKGRAYCLVCGRRRNEDKMKSTNYGHVCAEGACTIAPGSQYERMQQLKESTIKFFEHMMAKKVFPAVTLFKKPAGKKRK